MSKGTRRTRRKRRLVAMRLRTGKEIVRHRSKSGRTGKVRQSQLKGLKAAA